MQDAIDVVENIFLCDAGVMVMGMIVGQCSVGYSVLAGVAVTIRAGICRLIKETGVLA